MPSIVLTLQGKRVGEVQFEWQDEAAQLIGQPRPVSDDQQVLFLLRQELREPRGLRAVGGIPADSFEGPYEVLQQAMVRLVAGIQGAGLELPDVPQLPKSISEADSVA